MKDDAIYCEHPGGSEMAYIKYWRHRQLMWQQRQTIRWLIWALALAVAIAVIAIIKGVS